MRRQFHPIWRTLILAILLAVSTPLAAIAGHRGIPENAGAPHLDLAAMAALWADIPSLDDPDLYTLLGMGYIAGTLHIRESPVLPARQRTVGNFEWLYTRAFDDSDNDTLARVHIEEYASDSKAAVAFKQRSLVTRLYGPFDLLAVDDPLGNNLSDVRHEPDLALTGITAQVTRGAMLGQDVEGYRLHAKDFLDVTFQIGNLIAGVTILPDAASAEVTTPVAPDAESTPEHAVEWRSLQERAASIATTLGDRIDLVLSGADPPGVDSRLAGSLLPVMQRPVFSSEGYLDPTGFFPSSFWVDEVVTASDVGATSSYLRVFFPGDMKAAFTDDRSVSIMGMTFGSPEAARRVLQEKEPVLYHALGKQASSITIRGADYAVDYGKSLYGDNIPARDYTTDFVVEDILFSVSVQSIPSIEAAQTAALDFARTQALCLRSPGDCATAPLPASLFR